MPTYTITPLHLGDITRPRANMIYGYEGTEVLDFPLIAYYLDGEHKILVDTGGSAPDSAQGQRAAPYKRAPEQELGAALIRIGVSPQAVEYVIFTHLHWDHAGNNHLFSSAKFLCQKVEYENLVDPNGEKTGYDLDDVMKYNYELIDGDAELFDGISVLTAPGHTRGMQCVAVDTDSGKVVLTGDLITLRASLKYDPPRFNALLYNDSAAGIAQKSLDKVLAVYGLLLPGHDPDVFAPGMGLIPISNK